MTGYDMLVRKLLAGIAALAIVLTGLTVTASATAGEWGDALPVPGLAALNLGNYVDVFSVSCTSPGNCSAVGRYNDGSAQQGFLVDRVGGAWQQAVPVPGLGALDVGRNSAVREVSCSSDGNCSAVGNYNDGSGLASAFVVDRVGGVWQNAVPIPGVAALAIGQYGLASSVSCTSDGNCSALGQYMDGSSNFQLFVVDRVAGVWQDAIPVPGLIALNQNGQAESGGISCSSDGNCSAGGSYSATSGNQGFVVDRVSGVWQTAAPIPGLEALNVANVAAVNDLSCSSTGNCSAVGKFGGTGVCRRPRRWCVAVGDRCTGAGVTWNERRSVGALVPARWRLFGGRDCSGRRLLCGHYRSDRWGVAIGASHSRARRSRTGLRSEWDLMLECSRLFDDG